MTSQLSSINQIIDSGIELLSSIGLNGCSVEAIASRSGCAKGLVNYHFGSKDALLQAGLEGIELRLLCGAEPILIREAYDRFWLGILNEDSSGR